MRCNAKTHTGSAADESSYYGQPIKERKAQCRKEQGHDGPHETFPIWCDTFNVFSGKHISSSHPEHGIEFEEEVTL